MSMSTTSTTYINRHLAWLDSASSPNQLVPAFGYTGSSTTIKVAKCAEYIPILGTLIGAGHLLCALYKLAHGSEGASMHMLRAAIAITSCGAILAFFDMGVEIYRYRHKETLPAIKPVETPPVQLNPDQSVTLPISTEKPVTEPFAKLETALYEVPAPKDDSISTKSMAKALDETTSSHHSATPRVESVSSFAKCSNPHKELPSDLLIKASGYQAIVTAPSQERLSAWWKQLSSRPCVRDKMLIYSIDTLTPHIAKLTIGNEKVTIEQFFREEGINFTLDTTQPVTGTNVETPGKRSFKKNLIRYTPKSKPRTEEQANVAITATGKRKGHTTKNTPISQAEKEYTRKFSPGYVTGQPRVDVVYKSL